jgi:hypothetical protein
MIKSRIMRWAVYVARMGGRRSAHMLLVERTGGKSLLGRPKHKQDYNIKMYLFEVVWGSMKWIVMAQDADWLLDAVSVQQPHVQQSSTHAKPEAANVVLSS